MGCGKKAKRAREKAGSDGGEDMNNRQRVDAILHGRSYDRMPVVAFGYWVETLDKWAAEGHITQEDAQGYRCLLYTSPSPRDFASSRMPSSA